LDESWFNKCKVVGISAGASTPDDLIDGVVDKIKEIGHITEKEIVYE
jgi:4-hydroxy-3-methylbut-2-enyl diphosphate reductase IspH